MSQMTPLFQPKPIIPNTINSDSLSSKPPVKCESYTDAYDVRLRQKQLQFFSYLVCFSTITALLFQSGITFNIFSQFNIFSWTTFNYTIKLCLSGGIVFCLRSATKTIYEEVYPSIIARTLATVASPDTWTTLGLYTLSGFVTVFSYFSTISDEERITDLFERPTGHYIDVRQLNQKNIFIALYVIILSAKYGSLYLAKRRYVSKITRVQQPLFHEMKGSMATILCTSAKEALCGFAITYLVFMVFNVNIYYRVASTVGMFNRVLDSPIVGFRWIDLHLFTRVILSGIITTSLWNFVNHLFDATIASVVSVTEPYANQFDCIVTGLANKDDEVIQTTAFNELAMIACKDPKKRKELFACMGKKLEESAWHRVMMQCFHVIHELRASINAEYQTAKPVQVPTVPIVKIVEPTLRNRLQFSEDSDIYSSQRKHHPELDDRTATLFGQVDELIDSVPSPSKSIVIQKTRNDTLVRINKLVAILKNIEIKCGYKGYFARFYQESRVFEIQRVFKKYQLIMWAIQILGSLTAASFKEDSYGFVQLDISSVLNQLLGCYQDIEKYVQKEKVVIEEVEAVKKTLEEAILQIVVTFNDHLKVFKIEKNYMQTWEKFSCFH